MADVAREDASVIISDLRELDLHHKGTIAIEEVDSAISDAADEGREVREGPAIGRRRLGAGRGPHIGGDRAVGLVPRVHGDRDADRRRRRHPGLAGADHRRDGRRPRVRPARRRSAWRSSRSGATWPRSRSLALAVGFPLAIVVTYVATRDLARDRYRAGLDRRANQVLTAFISHPDWFSVIIAFLAGTAGMISLTCAKSGALIGVLISVTTIPAAGNMAVAAAYKDWDEAWGATQQLGDQPGLRSSPRACSACTSSGASTSAAARSHLSDPERKAAGLPRTGRRTGRCPHRQGDREASEAKKRRS